MALYPAVIAPWFEQRFLKINSDGVLVPNAGGFVYVYAAGTSTPIDSWTDSDGLVAQTNPIELDADGRPPDPIYLIGTGYKFAVHDSDDTPLYAVDDVEDFGRTFASSWGQLLGTPTSYTDTEVIPATERYAQIDSSGGATTVYLSPASDMTQPLTIKNMNGNTVTITPDGVDTIEGSLASFVLPAASSPTFPSVLLASDGVSSISILSSHGV